jgi:hypothetical protein
MKLDFDAMKKLAQEKDELRMKKEVVDGVDVYIFSYMIWYPDTFDNPLVCWFRGTTFDADGNLLSRPFPKFFNINEKPETTIPFTDLKDYTAHEKYDGSLAIPVVINGKIFWKTIKSFYSDVAVAIDNFYTLSDNKYDDLIFDAYNKNKTVLFEYTSPSNRIVVPYNDDALTPIATVDNETGIVTPMLEGISDFDLDEIKRLEGIEGYVLYKNDGTQLIKVKTEWYIERHKLRSDLTPSRIISYLENDTIDDVIAAVASIRDDIQVEFIIMLQDMFNDNVIALDDTIQSIFNRLYIPNRKEFALTVLRDFKEYAKFLFLLFDKKEEKYQKALKEYVADTLREKARVTCFNGEDTEEV